MRAILPSIETVRQLRISKSRLWKTITTCPTLSKEFQAANLESYYLLYWSAEYFISKMKYGTIEHQGKTYHVFFDANPDGTTLGKIKQLDKGRQIKLSFRSPLPVTDLPNVVYVSSTHITASIYYQSTT